MKKQIILSAVFAALVSSTTTHAQKNPHPGDAGKAIAVTNTIPREEALYFSTREDAEKALVGYNYGLTALPDGRVQAFVSGLNGSGLQSSPDVVRANSQASLAKVSVTAQPSEAKSAFPQISLQQKLNGQAAIDALGDKLPLVAKAYDMSAERLEKILQNDLTAWIDPRGRLLYVESDTKSMPKSNSKFADKQSSGVANATTISGTGTLANIATSTADPFTLHSKPNANRIIYLDFNGYVATATAWYSGTLTAQAYDLDGKPSAFSTAELANIREIWQRVAEDYAPFDVDVTTQEPSIEALQRTTNTDTQYGMRAVITHSMSELCSQSCGGVAYVNVFSEYSSSQPDYYKPAWAFFDSLNNGAPEVVAEAVSHEVGHTLNLNHDGTSNTEYYEGQGSGATGWAPIMGASYYQPVTQWSKGEYPDANNSQDDIAVIAAAGTPLRSDDYPSTTASAAPLSGTPSAVLQIGIIERNTDLDVFTFSTDGGSVQFDVASGSVAPNLDLSVKLVNAAGNTVASANPANSLSASLTTTLSAGQYFLQIDGVGYGDLTTGYSDYASLGQYQITGHYPKGSTTTIAPTAVISALPTSGVAPLTVSLNGSKSSDQEGTIVGYDWSYGDGTANGSAATVNHVYQTPGTYTATLTVTDNSGLKNSSTQTITVTQAPASVNMKVGSTTVTRKLLSRGKSQCVATVKVNYGTSTITNAAVTGVWSGSVNTNFGSTTVTGSTSGTTGTNGTVDISSSILPRNAAGTCAFSVTKVAKTGYIYDGSGQVTGSFSW